MDTAFRGASNMQITATDKPDLSGVTSMAVMFFGAYTFNGDISGWDVSAVRNMSFMFFHATAFNGDIGGWDVSAVTNMNAMFNGANAFRQNLGRWYIVPGTTASYDGKTNLEVLSLSAQNAVLDGQTPVYTLVAGEGDADNGSFTLTGGALSIKAAEASGGDYRIRIAVGSVEFGTDNARAITVVVPASLPDAPTRLTATRNAAGTETTITWTAPTNGGATITGYSLQRATGIIDPFTPVTPAHTGTDARYTDTGLSPGTYRYRVAAINSVGTGDYSNSVTVAIASADDFVTTWRTTTANNAITFPGVGTYTIHWGDGTTEQVTGATTHSYATAGDYDIIVSNNITHFNLNDGADKDKLIEVKQWGTASWRNMEGAFRGASNMQITATEKPDLRGWLP